MISIAVLALMQPFGHDHYLNRDGGWLWLTDPRALWVRGHVWVGSNSKDWAVTVSDYDPVKKTSESFNLVTNFERDDHAHPALLELPDHRVMAFYSKHGGTDLWMRTTVRPADIREWTPAKAISPNDTKTPLPKDVWNGYTYPSVVQLSGERGRIYLTYRGTAYKPMLSWSDDLGKTWSTAKTLAMSASPDPTSRPSVKLASNDRDRIDFFFTDGFPKTEPTNSIYFARYEKGRFTNASGNVISSVKQLPIRPEQAEVVYDAKESGVRSWIWDAAEDRSGRPYVVYARFPDESHHQYFYAYFNGQRWVHRKIVDAGKWFQDTPEGKKEGETYHSGGLCLDPEDPRFVYLSRATANGRFEMERWFTEDSGDHWSHVALTGNSKHNSVRPSVIRGERPAKGPVVSYLNLYQYVNYNNFSGTTQATDEIKGPWTANDPAVMKAVWNWSRSNLFSHSATDWTMAPLYSGLLDVAESQNISEAREFVAEIGKGLGWKLGPRPFHADDQAVGQAYLQLFEKDQDPTQIAAIKQWADAQLARSHDEPLEWKNNVGDREWAWCDALFMGPPTLAKLAQVTGDHRYMELCLKLWKKTSDFLYDPSEQLFFRDGRFFTQREANGKKIFWSRGNGWVLAGAARVLQCMSKDDPLRADLVAQFQAMAEKIRTIQTKDGTWHSGLLDPDSYPIPETSGTGFFCYAMAWGIRAGLLPSEKFRPTVDRAYAALLKNVDLNGRVGFVQPIGDSPKATKFYDTDAFGVGAFLLAANQVWLLDQAKH